VTVPLPTLAIHGSAGEAALAATSRLEQCDDPAVVISVVAAAQLAEWAAVIDSKAADQVPLRGATFAVKDNIDVVGLPTTAGCPTFAQGPATKSAAVVAALLEAGALPVAKVNLDQFATGLVGTRSPHGTPRNPINPVLIPGGSSSGSAVAVATGLVHFALGTDTAGSGRVPAAMCGLVGIKPTRGRLSSAGVLPAVRSIDCVSVFAHDLDLAARVIDAAAGFDVSDPFSLPAPSARTHSPRRLGELGVLGEGVLEGIGASQEIRGAYCAALDELSIIGYELVEIDPQPLFDIGDQLYGGAWVAERVTGLGDFASQLDRPELFDPVVGKILSNAQTHTAGDVHRSMYTLAGQLLAVRELFEQVDALAFPTVAVHPTLQQVAGDPMGVNTRLGRLTTFTNLANLATVTFPMGAPLRSSVGDLPPFSMSLQGPAWSDSALVEAAARITGRSPIVRAASESSGWIRLVVAGAHLRGLPLEHQLVDRGARFVETTVTAPVYRMFALANSTPPKPAVVHCGEEGAALEVDVWDVCPEAFGSFVAAIPAPLCIGKVELSDGSVHPGFLSEPRALAGATDITHFGGWRAYMSSLA
jgi:allophanate hydrolase